MSVTRGFKQTDVGVIPEEWDVEWLAAVAEKVMVGIASAATHAYRPRGVALFRNQNIKANSLDDSDLLFVDAEYEKVFRNKRLKAGDLLTARTGYPGVTCVVPSAYEDAQSFTTLITRPKKERIDSEYLCQFVNSTIGQAFFERSQIGGAQKNVNVATLRLMPVPVPLPIEQRAIAAALSDVDALIASLDRLIAKKRNLKQAAMQQLLTGQTRLPGFGGKWATKRVDELGDVLAGKALNAKAPGRQRPYLRTKNVLDGRIDLEDVLEMPFNDSEFERFRIKNGDILLNEGQSLDLVGRASMYRDEMAVPCAMQNQLLRFRANSQASPAFAEHTFRRCQQSGVFAAIATQTTSVAHLGSVRFCKLQLLWPTELKEQSAIATVLSDMDAEISVIENRRNKTKLVKQGMMQELLTGRTRLV